MKNRKAFTIVEISIAAILLVVVLGAAYKVFSGVSLGFQRGSKALSMQNSMRNGLNFIREEMQRASYSSEVRINGTKVVKNGFEFKLCLEDSPDIKSDKVIAEWFICKPFNKADNSGVVFKSTFRCSNGRFYYSRVCVKGSDSEPEIKNRLVLDEIGKIKLSVEGYDSTSAEGSMISIETFAVGVKEGQPDMTIAAQTGAKIDIEVLRKNI